MHASRPDPTGFYDALATDYHLIYADWEQSIRRQATALDRLIRAHAWEAPPVRLLDGSCGIGTQAIGLALRGYQVHATDLSPQAVTRATAEAARLGAALTAGVADLRALDRQVSGEFDVVLSCDNSVAHLLDEADLLAATRAMHARLRPGGVVLISVRDYDYLVDQRPHALMPQVFGDESERRIVFQVWDWADDGRHYRLTLFLVQQQGADVLTRQYAATSRAWLRAELGDALAQAGFGDVRWHMPQDTGYHQPIVTARAP